MDYTLGIRVKSRVTPRFFFLTWVTGYMMVVPFLEMEKIGMIVIIGVQQISLVLPSPCLPFGWMQSYD